MRIISDYAEREFGMSAEDFLEVLGILTGACALFVAALWFVIVGLWAVTG